MSMNERMPLYELIVNDSMENEGSITPIHEIKKECVAIEENE